MILQLYTIASFYKFINLKAHNLAELRASFLTICQGKEIFGSILLAEEGINGTIAGRAQDIEDVIQFIRETVCQAFELKYASSEFIPFRKLKILLKKEIVTLGVPDTNPSQKTGIPVPPKAWNQLISEPDVFLLDTRNTYEVELGSFKAAVNPSTETFRDFPNYVKENLDQQKHKKIAMFCTGGIRCEKASSYLLDQGFDTVYQLDGGILKYLNEISPEESLWEGECFVFDERGVVES